MPKIHDAKGKFTTKTQLAIGTLAATSFETVEPTNGITTKRYKKDLIQTGIYSHPVEGWKMTVDTANMHYWVKTFQDMKANGVKVPILATHDFNDATDTMGYIDDMYIENNKLYAIHEFRGEKNIETALVNGQVSIGIKTVKDGKGNEYKNAIQHVAITPTPVVPNQDEFQIAASLSTCLFLALDKSGETNMDKSILEKLEQLTGVSELTDDTVMDALDAFVQKTKDSKQSLTLSLGRLKELEALHIPHVDKETLEDRAELFSEHFDRLAEDGILPEGQLDEWKDLLIGAEGNRFALGLSTNGGREKALTRMVISLLQKLPPRASTKELTGSQTKVLDIEGRDGKSGFNEQLFNRMSGYMNVGGNTNGK